ncbi:MAG TPA: class I SAM-dependent methyltransferase [Candidatus Atribacteria bacterium]|nr:class I SAM-dependent methyltransferase [Candidatus Atribacteria bacterium]
MVALLPNKLSGKNERAENDQYFTPPKLAELMCREVGRAFNDTIFYPTEVLDPSAGTGIWGKVWKEIYPHAKITGIDIDPSFNKPEGYSEWLTGNFLTTDFGNKQFDLVLTNPPFKYAEKFVNKGLEIVKPYGVVAYLLNLTFLGSVGRGKRLFNNRKNPTNIIVSSRRVDFTGQGSPHTEIAMFVWKKLPEFGKWKTYIEWVDWKEGS